MNRYIVDIMSVHWAEGTWIVDANSIQEAREIVWQRVCNQINFWRECDGFPLLDKKCDIEVRSLDALMLNHDGLLNTAEV